MRSVALYNVVGYCMYLDIERKNLFTAHNSPVRYVHWNDDYDTENISLLRMDFMTSRTHLYIFAVTQCNNKKNNTKILLSFVRKCARSILLTLFGFNSKSKARYAKFKLKIIIFICINFVTNMRVVLKGGSIVGALVKEKLPKM